MITVLKLSLQGSNKEQFLLSTTSSTAISKIVDQAVKLCDLLHELRVAVAAASDVQHSCAVSGGVIRCQRGRRTKTVPGTSTCIYIYVCVCNLTHLEHMLISAWCTWCCLARFNLLSWAIACHSVHTNRSSDLEKIGVLQRVLIFRRP